MRRKFLIILLLLPAFNYHFSFANSDTTIISGEKVFAPFYLGVGTGINDVTGLIGVRGDFLASPKLMVNTALGLGSWGYKISGGVAYYKKPKGWSYGIGVSIATGYPEIKTKMEVLHDTAVVNIQNGITTTTTTQVKEMKEVKMQFFPAATVNLVLQRNWVMRNNTRFYFEFGYAIAVNNRPWKLLTKGYTLTDVSDFALKISQPGGLLLGIGFMFPIN